MGNPWKLTNLFKRWTKKDFLGKGDESGWEKAMKKGRKISIATPQSSRYWVNGDDSKYYSTDELAAGDTVDIESDTKTGEASGDVTKARVDSSAIDLIEYDPETKVLSIAYKNGTKMYDFPDVPEDEVKALLNAESKGKYVAFNIVPKYSENRR